MLVLVTRPRQQAEETAGLLRAAGHQVLLDPLLEINPLPAPTLAAGEVAAVAVTSANAAPAATAIPHRMPIFAVGQATARALRAIGRPPAGIAGGDGGDLALLIADAVPAGSIVLHLCGRNVREGLAAGLTAAGYRYRPAAVYEAVAAAGLAPATAAAIRQRRLDAGLFFSPRSAALFAAHVRAAALDSGLAAIIAVCLSDAVASELAGLRFRAIRVADARDQKALLRRLDG